MKAYIDIYRNNPRSYVDWMATEVSDWEEAVQVCYGLDSKQYTHELRYLREGDITIKTESEWNKYVEGIE